jgi:hypothetical protein
LAEKLADFWKYKTSQTLPRGIAEMLATFWLGQAPTAAQTRPSKKTMKEGPNRHPRGKQKTSQHP